MSDNSVGENQKHIFIAGGGSGGHIYPGLAIAEALKKQDPSLQVHFVGTPIGLEKKIVPKSGFPLHLIQSGKLNMSGQIFEKIKTLVKIPYGLIQAAALLFKNRPIYVLGVGGYASGPFVLAAFLLKPFFNYRIGIWEPNAMPGMANRLLSGCVDEAFIVFEEARLRLKTKKTHLFGMPIRGELDKKVCHVVRKDPPLRVFHFGGSQGSRIIGSALSEMIQKYNPTDMEFIHQTGVVDFEKFKKSYEFFPQAKAFDFIYDMPMKYDWADVVICRGGASTLTEIAAYGLPSIIVPLPAADGHQEHNARSFADKKAALLLMQKDLTADRLYEVLSQLKKDADLKRDLSAHVSDLFIENASHELAAKILG